MTPLTTGNTAKVYCLNWIENYIQTQGQGIRILDVGSGTSNNFVELIRRYPNVTYVGVEPYASACEKAKRDLQGNNVKIINDSAYDIMGRLVDKPFDIVVSFSVMEHVVQRQKFLNSIAECMHNDSYFLINYDAGHFKHPASFKERIKNVVGPLLAIVGVEQYYQRFMPENEFRQMVAQAGMTIQEAKSFNTMLKGIHKVVPAEYQDEHLQRWLEYELWLNEIDTPYNDDLAKWWVTRNFIIRKGR